MFLAPQGVGNPTSSRTTHGKRTGCDSRPQFKIDMKQFEVSVTYEGVTTASHLSLKGVTPLSLAQSLAEGLDDVSIQVTQIKERK